MVSTNKYLKHFPFNILHCCKNGVNFSVKIYAVNIIQHPDHYDWMPHHTIIMWPLLFSRIRLNSLREYITGYGQIAHNSS